MNVNDFNFWYILGQHWNWFWFLIIIAIFGRGAGK